MLKMIVVKRRQLFNVLQKIKQGTKRCSTRYKKNCCLIYFSENILFQIQSLDVVDISTRSNKYLIN